jgi:hypothetical protein
VLTEKATFFGQWGFTPNTAVQTVITAIEFEQKNDRYRAYGYLFGYPDYAIDFFVQASIDEQKNGVFVTRDFIHLPVFIEKKGYFTYAVPKNHQKNELDVQLQLRANEIYKQFLTSRMLFLTEKNTFRAQDFLKSIHYSLIK